MSKMETHTLSNKSHKHTVYQVFKVIISSKTLGRFWAVNTTQNKLDGLIGGKLRPPEQMERTVPRPTGVSAGSHRNARHICSLFSNEKREAVIRLILAWPYYTSLKDSILQGHIDAENANQKQDWMKSGTRDRMGINLRLISQASSLLSMLYLAFKRGHSE